MKKRLLLLAPLLASCGWIPLPERTQPDFWFINSLPGGVVQPKHVGYMSNNQMGYINIPDLPYSHMQFDATLTYHGSASQLRIQLFISAQRPDCPEVQSLKPGYNSALLCDGPAGGTQFAELLLKPNEPIPVHIENSVLDEAVRGKQLYLGIRLLEGSTTPDEYMQVSDIRINGRL